MTKRNAFFFIAIILVVSIMTPSIPRVHATGIAFVGGAIFACAGTGSTCTKSYTSSSGNFVIVSIIIFTTGSASAPTDTGGSTYTQIGSTTTNGNVHESLWSTTGTGSIASTSITAHFSGLGAAPGVTVAEYSGGQNTLGGNTSTTSNICQEVISFTLTAANNWFIAGFGDDNGGGGMTTLLGNRRETDTANFDSVIMDNTAATAILVTNSFQYGAVCTVHAAIIGVELIVPTSTAYTESLSASVTIASAMTKTVGRVEALTAAVTLNAAESQLVHYFRSLTAQVTISSALTKVAAHFKSLSASITDHIAIQVQVHRVQHTFKTLIASMGLNGGNTSTFHCSPNNNCGANSGVGAAIFVFALGVIGGLILLKVYGDSGNSGNGSSPFKRKKPYQ